MIDNYLFGQLGIMFYASIYHENLKASSPSLIMTVILTCYYLPLAQRIFVLVSLVSS
jgi:hypothetical protein